MKWYTVKNTFLTKDNDNRYVLVDTETHSVLIRADGTYGSMWDLKDRMHLMMVVNEHLIALVKKLELLVK